MSETPENENVTPEKCECCLSHRAQRYVRCQLFHDQIVGYCNECAANGAEPEGIVRRYMDYYPFHTIPPQIINTVTVYNSETGSYDDLYEYRENNARE